MARTLEATLKVSDATKEMVVYGAAMHTETHSNFVERSSAFYLVENEDLIWAYFEKMQARARETSARYGD